MILNLYLYLLLPFFFLPAMWETWVQLLGWEDTLEKVMATHSSILAGESSWTEEPGGLQSMGSQRVRRTEQLSTEQHPQSKHKTKRKHLL